MNEAEEKAIAHAWIEESLLDNDILKMRVDELTKKILDEFTQPDFIVVEKQQ